ASLLIGALPVILSTPIFGVRSRFGSSQADSFRGECTTAHRSSARRRRLASKSAAAGTRKSRTAASRARRPCVSRPPSRDSLRVDRRATLPRKILACSSAFTSAEVACTYGTASGGEEGQRVRSQQGRRFSRPQTGPLPAAVESIHSVTWRALARLAGRVQRIALGERVIDKA